MDVVGTGALVVFLVLLAVAMYSLISVSRSEDSTIDSLTAESSPRRNDPQLRRDQMPEWERIVRGEKDSDKDV